MSTNHISSDRLDSWKDIAAYLDRDVRTVIRWQQKGLPVHRVPGGKRQAVFAYRAEIDDWLLGKTANGTAVATALPEENADSFQILPAGSASGARSRTRRRVLKYTRLGLGMAVLLSGIAVVNALLPKSGNPVKITSITRISRDGLFKTGLATDGSKLYFGELADGRLQLSWIRVDGGAVGHLATPFAKALVEDISSDGNEILVRGRDGIEDEAALWIVPTNGGPPRRVGVILCHAAALSPDGKAIAYSHENSIFITLDEGISSLEVHRFESDPYYLHWSKSGNRLQLVLRNTATVDLSPWEIEFADNFEVRAISRIPLAPAKCCSAWVDTPDYEFFATGIKDESRIGVLPKRRHWWQSTSPQSIELSTPLGTVTSLTSDLRTGRLFAIGTEPRRGEFIRFEPFSRASTPFLPGISGLYLDFSRNGEWITYTSIDDFSLWVARADGAARRQLTLSFDVVELPRWSPDGTRIAFTAKRADQPWRIYVIHRDGGTPREASSSTDNQGAPTWSPDGQWLAYANVACQETHNCAVHRIELATGKVDTLPGSDGLRTARWSPDGRYIVALRPKRHELLLFDLAKQRWTKLADSIVGDDLSWSHDSRFIYSNRPIGDKPAIVRIPITEGKPQSAVNLESLSRLSGKFDTGLCVGPDDSIILTRQINSSEVYALDWSSR